ncbi:Imm63 family immunity protein [Colwelliaceae bacterium 6471]
MYQLSEIRVKVEKLGKLIGANQHQLPTYGKSRDFGYSHVEVDKLSYHLVTVERGQELERRSTAEFDELLYYIFLDATSDIAGNFELKNRIEDQDS